MTAGNSALQNLRRRASTGFAAVTSAIVILGMMTAGCRLEPVWAGEAPDSQSHARPVVVETRIAGDTISSVTVRHIQRAIRRAENDGAECLVIELDTPGGLVSATREIVKSILASRVCVVVYVAPTGAEAASAGGFITLSSHVAVMSPATTIGAMHPVSIGGLPVPSPSSTPADDPEDSDNRDRPAPSRNPSAAKSVNNTAAWHSCVVATATGRSALSMRASSPPKPRHLRPTSSTLWQSIRMNCWRSYTAGRSCCRTER